MTLYKILLVISIITISRFLQQGSAHNVLRSPQLSKQIQAPSINSSKKVFNVKWTD